MRPVTVDFPYQTSPYECVDTNGLRGCGAEAGQPCVLHSDVPSGRLAGTPRATLHAHRRRGPAIPPKPTQPAPVANDQPPIVPQVIADLEARMAHGVKTYGVALQPFNGRDAAQDAYEEAMDLTVYLRQLIIERAAMRAELEALRAEVAELRSRQQP